MRGVRILVFYAIVLLLSIVLLGGCGSSQQPGSGEGKQALLRKIKAQQAQIDGLKCDIEEVQTELEKCRGGLSTAKKDKASAKISSTTKRRNPSAVKRRPRTSSRSKTTKRKGGCPCKRKSAKAQISKK